MIDREDRQMKIKTQTYHKNKLSSTQRNQLDHIKSKKK